MIEMTGMTEMSGMIIEMTGMTATMKNPTRTMKNPNQHRKSTKVRTLMQKSTVLQNHRPAGCIPNGGTRFLILNLMG